MFYGYLGYFMINWYIFVHLVHFSGFGIVYQEKSGNPARDPFLLSKIQNRIKKSRIQNLDLKIRNLDVKIRNLYFSGLELTSS
jgi:hypothetical protein